VDIQDDIQQALRDIERDEQCVIMLAVESGSRAWGFASVDSDYDVRFIYVRRPEWYLSVDDKRDVIEKPITGDLDVSGWDIRKALRLMRKSNPPLLEWLQSPIVYRERADLMNEMRVLAQQFYAPRSAFHHYASMAKGNMREYLHGDEVWTKKYFYVLRPLLAMRWIEEGRGLVPIEFHVLLDAIHPSGPLRDAVDELLRVKRAGGELSRGPRNAVISDFIAGELERLDPWAPEQGQVPGTELLDQCFRNVLRNAWPAEP
jgi:predicted nucleotidyltransferase